ncbi:hypothetical protein [Ancylomarina longa]|nr:hypothetical protein [Ancylomarina longa]
MEKQLQAFWDLFSFCEDDLGCTILYGNRQENHKQGDREIDFSTGMEN